MNVLYFHQHFTTPQGSTGTRSYEMARRLIERGHRVTMVCGSNGMAKSGLRGDFRRGSRDGDVNGIHVIEFLIPYSNYDGLLKRALLFFKFALRSTKVALTRDYDLLFATSTPLTAAIPGIVMKLFRAKPFVFEVRDLWPELPKAMGIVKNPIVLFAMGVLERAAYRLADQCIGLSPGIVEGIQSKSVPTNRVTMIPNGCDLDLFKPADGKGWERDGIVPGDFLAIFSGAHGLANGLDAVLDAGVVLRDRGRLDIKLLLVGDGSAKPRLVERVQRERISNVVFFSPVPKTEMAKITARCHVGLMILANVPAFYFGTSPNKFFDYIASGLPVINNYPGWLAGLISQYECGTVVAPNEPEQFADALIELASNHPKFIRFGKNARALAETKFARDILADQFLECIEHTHSRFIAKRSKKSIPASKS